jgi:hypothetical protein
MGFQNAQLSTIAEIQNGYDLQIPEYQRGYAWGKKQWEELWDDLNNLSLRSHGDHYGGALMFRSLNEFVGAKEAVEVVDGQQRLTTISLLLRALSCPHIAIEFKDNEQLQTHFDFFVCGKAELAPRLGQFVSFYGKNMEHAADFFSLKVADLEPEVRKSFADAILNRFKLFVLSIQPGFDVHVAFETINNRGKKLTLLEILKNRLIYLASIAQDRAAGHIAASTVHSSWKGIYHWLGKGPSLLNDDDFLRAHSMGWFLYQKEALWLENQLFDDEFSTRPNGITPEQISIYVRSLETAAAWWFHLNYPEGMPPLVQRKLQSLDRTSFAGVLPVLLWALIRLGGKDALRVANPSRETEWSKPFESLLVQAERFAVMILMGNDRKSNYAQGDLNWLAHWLAHPDKPFYEDTSSAPAAPTEAGAAVSFVSDYLKSLLNPQGADLADDVFPDARFQWPGYFMPAKMVAVAADQIRSRNGFYGWDFGKLVIYEWEQWLRGNKGLVEKKIPWEKFSWDQTVEHIYPKEADPEWNTVITFDGRTSLTLRKAVINSLGNLLLLSSSRNPSLSNLPYRGGADPQKAKSCRYRDGSYSEWQVANVCKDWNILSIAARGIAMMRFAEKRWKFQLVEPSAKLTAWLPMLFGDQADAIQRGAGSNNQAITPTRLKNLVAIFESKRPR